MGSVIEVVDPNNVNANGRGSASRILRVRGVAQSDGDTASLAVTIVGGAGNITEGGATSTAAVAAGASPAVIKNSGGTLFAIVVTTPGTAALTITDGMGGTIIAVVPANQPVGDLPMSSGRPFSTSLYANSGSNTPAVTFIYA